MKKYKIISSIATVLLFVFVAGCSEMDETYRHFLEGGKIKYAGKADSVQIIPGNNRLMMSWVRSSDPSVSRAKIYWNNRTDSLDVAIDRSEPNILVPLENMPEGNYAFEIITFDDEGNRSVVVEATGQSHGPVYQNALLSRIVESTNFLASDILSVHWAVVTDSSLVNTELVYRNDSKETETLIVTPGIDSTVLENFSRGQLKYRSLFRPHPLSPDTFYSRYDSITVKGLPLELDKTGWVATASSFDDRAGNSYRPPSNAIDNNPSTIWVNKISSDHVYPHWIQVNMGQVHEDIEGFAIITRVGDPAARPKTVEFLTSMDGEEWVSFGDFVLEDSGDKQLVAIPETVSAQYFKLIAKDPHRSGVNVAMAEVGVFIR